MNAILLSNSVRMPRLGLGLYKVPPARCADLVRLGVELGYRLFDTASVYGNEPGVGEALEGKPEVWITTKISPKDMERVDAAFRKSLESLKRIDLLLLHWPGCAGHAPDSTELREIRLKSWKVCEELYRQKQVRAIGVSNFIVRHLEQLKSDGADIVPMVNQVELHPDCPNVELLEYCRANNIALQAYSPLGTAKATLRERAAAFASKEFGMTPAQALLAWGLLRGTAVIPKASSQEHLSENLKALELAEALSEEDRGRLLRRGNEIGENRRYCWDPNTVA